MTSRLVSSARSAGGAALAVLPLLLAPVASRAQSLADRIAAAGNGEVRVTYAARPGACGDGRDVVALGRALYVHNSIESYGRWSGVACAPGPVRVTLGVRDREVASLRVRVGAARAGDASGRVTDLGTVPAAAAADYFVALAQRADANVAKEAVLAAALADSANIAPGLLRLARDTQRPRVVRRRAVQWLGEVGGTAVVTDLDALARRGEDDAEVRQAALVGLANVENEGGIPTLIRYVRSPDDPWLQKKAVFWLGQTESRDAHALLRALVDSAAAREELRGAAIFALGHGSAVTDDDIAFLQRAYGRLDALKLKDQVLMAVAQQQSGGAWLVARARDEGEPMEARKKAAFWAGQGGTPVKELVALYRGTREQELKKHLLFVLSQRDDPTATDELLAVARSDESPAMRKQALFWLGQKDDPRVAQLIRDIVTH